MLLVGTMATSGTFPVTVSSLPGLANVVCMDTLPCSLLKWRRVRIWVTTCVVSTITARDQRLCSHLIHHSRNNVRRGRRQL
jgi:hypothetical protein